jgi:membrane-associated protease RseP (regulator of RpoE activity)
MKTFLFAFLAVAFLSAGTLYAQEKAALGVTMSDNTPGGVLITKVVDGSPAAKIGLQAGDRILAINDQKTNNYRDVTRIIAASKPNTPVELSVIRGAWKTKLKVELGSAAAVFTSAPKYVTPPVPAHSAPSAPPDWDPFDFNQQDTAAAYGGV